MSTFYSIFFILCTLYNGGVKSAQWSSTSLPDGQILYACAGDTVILTWQYSLTSAEVLDDIQWLYDGQSQELVAMSSRGHFFPTPTFSQRVSLVDNAGLSMSRVMVPDSGNYSVEVTFNTQGGTSRNVLIRTAVLYVSESLMTHDGVLHVTLLRDPVYDPVSKQWILQLQCGNFIFMDIPPYEVEWTTPSGEVHNSTGFKNGSFYLSIPMPIKSGNYTCRIPAHLSARACLHSNDNSEGQATVSVESAEARLLLLEKENSDLKTTVEDLKATVAEQASRLTSQNQTVEDLKATVAEQASRLTSQNQTVEDLIQEVQRQKSQQNQTQMRVEKIEDAERRQVAFHATGFTTVSFANTPLLFVNVFYNQGNGYDHSTGYFTAPYSGLYFFIAKTAVANDESAENHYLMVDSQAIDTAYTSHPREFGLTEQSPVHGVVHLTHGQRVWVTCGSGVPLQTYFSAFTGFMLSRDP